MLTPHLIDRALPLHLSRVERPLHSIQRERTDSRLHVGLEHRIGGAVNTMKRLHIRPIVHEAKQAHRRIQVVRITNEGRRSRRRAHELMVHQTGGRISGNDDGVIRPTLRHASHSHSRVRQKRAVRIHQRQRHVRNDKPVGVHRTDKVPWVLQLPRSRTGLRTS